MLKCLRITVTALSLAACFLLIGLWVRSYSWLDRIDWPVGRFVEGRTAASVSVNGLLLIGVQPEQYNIYAAQSAVWRINSVAIENARIQHLDRGVVGFKLIRGK